jgi:hypothetical protein
MAPYFWSLQQTPGGGRIYCYRLKTTLAEFLLGKRPVPHARLEFLNGDPHDFTRANVHWNSERQVCRNCGGTRFFGHNCWYCYTNWIIDRKASDPHVFRNAARSDHYAYHVLMNSSEFRPLKRDRKW